jgi:CRP-like cAMP-binding protein
MGSESLVELLRGVELFDGLKPLQITEIARHAEQIVFQPGERIIEEDDTGDAAYLIVSGRATRTRGPFDLAAPEPVAPGSLVGEMAMLIETRYTSTIAAEGQVRALRIGRSGLHGQMVADPGLADHLVQKISGRLHVLANELRRIDRLMAGYGQGVAGARALPAPAAMSLALKGIN